MTRSVSRSTGDVRPHRSSTRLVVWAAVLTSANVVADVVIGSPMMAMPQLLEHFDTDQAAWLNASAMLAGAIWSPLLAKSADVYGKRRVLVATLLLACAGALVCLVAPNSWIFLGGRFLQGAAFAAVFLTVALVMQICTARRAMAMVGLVTSSSSIVGIVEPFLTKPIIDAFGFRGVFAVAAVLAAVAAVGVRLVIPESPVRSAARIDVVGALLLGVGLGAVLAYISLGADRGWLSMAPLLVVGLVALSSWTFHVLRIAEPVIDIRALAGPILLALVTLILAAGSFRSMLQLVGLVAYVPSELGLGYGLGDGEAIATLFGAANLGIAVGGIGAGWLAGRIGPAWPLLAGIVLGAAGTFAMVAGVSAPPLAIACSGTLGIAAGAIGASGYNVATSLAAPERQGTTAGLVSIVVALGSVVFTIAGAEVLKASRVPDVIADGAPVSTAAGVHVYIALAGLLFVLATIPAFTLARSSRRPTRTAQRTG
ncbi:MFS transporter [Mycolicibacterium sp. GCM10028919]|uniref:MFS transporter n=1 Tax=Mycolicibacterium sp. GCM10028919 TaxID=3273401 RepID=UPI003612051E